MAGRSAPQLKLSSGILLVVATTWYYIYVCRCVCVYDIYVVYYKYFACYICFLKFVTSFIVLHFDFCS